MAMLSSTISFIVLLLVSYSYSAPIIAEFESTTVEYEITNTTIVNEENSTVIQVELMSDSTTVKTNVPVNLHMLTSSEESDSGERRRALSRPSRVLENSTYLPVTDSIVTDVIETTSSSLDKSGVEISTIDNIIESTSEVHDKRDVEQSTTDDSVEVSTKDDSVEATTEFHDKRDVEESTTDDSVEVSTKDDSVESTSEVHDKRDVEETTVFDIVEKTSESVDTSSVENVAEISTTPSVDSFLFTTVESSVAFNSRAIGLVKSESEIESSTNIPLEYQPEMTTYVQPSSSIDTFVVYTGLLRDETSTTIEHETSSQSDVDVSTELPVTSETVRKVIAVIPGEVSGPEVVVRPVVQKELSQGQNQSIIEEKKSYN